MVGHLLSEVSANVCKTKVVHEKFGELEDAREKAAHIGEEGCVLLLFRDEFVVFAHHGDAGCGGNTDYFAVTEECDEAADDRHSFVVVAGVVVHLATAGLLHWEGDGVAEAFENMGDRDARLGEERVVVAGDEERDTQGGVS